MKHIDALRAFYSGRRVFVTGGQGFKGSILLAVLEELGAEVRNIGLTREDNILFPELIGHLPHVESHEVDVRERDEVSRLMSEWAPEVVLHLAAQPIVSVGYADPYQTFSSNVMGTVNVLDAVRWLKGKVSVVSVTSDKAYFNAESSEGYTEDALLLGRDPYSASKSAAEHVIHSYKTSYFDSTLGTEDEKIVSPARAGNVIGGGDFSIDRLVPDMARALHADVPVSIRNFTAMRPYEHVLDAVYAYLVLAAGQWEDSSLAGAYNIGPNDESLMRNEEVIGFFERGSALQVRDVSGGESFHETRLLKLNSSKFRETFAWEPVWGSKEDILKPTLEWYAAWAAEEPMADITLAQVRSFLSQA